ncbi:ERF family protein [Ligilactobacillus salivarius]|uniref:ERF family protein n=1 Tax=Ligilactobacillus salivarius TaxID=1624 RepID=UPI003D05E809
MAFDEIFMKIQSLMIVPKDKRNDFGRYDYRTAEGIKNKLREVINENEDLKAHLTETTEIVVIDGWKYVKATEILETPNGKHEVSAFARETENKKGMDQAQITGSSTSYARKYALNGLFAIGDETDPDDPNYPRETNNTRNNTRNNRPQKPTPIDEYNQLFNRALKALGTDKATLQAQVTEQVGKMFPNDTSSIDKLKHGIMILKGLIENEVNK